VTPLPRQRLLLETLSPCQRRTGWLLAVRRRLPANRFARTAGFDSTVGAAPTCASGADSVVDGAPFADAASEALAKTGFGDTGCDCAGCGAAAPAGSCASTGLLAGAALVDTGDAAAETGALVTSACAAIELSASAPGRSSRETTTAAPAVAPTAVATSTTRALRRKLGAGAR
jgi:hypothetical protein